MLKRYQVGDFVLQYEEGEQPTGAVEVREAASRPNKAQAATNKEAQPEAKSLEGLTVRELINICAEEHIETPRKPNKAQIIAAIRAARGE